MKDKIYGALIVLLLANVVYLHVTLQQTERLAQDGWSRATGAESQARHARVAASQELANQANLLRAEATSARLWLASNAALNALKKRVEVLEKKSP